MNNSDDNDDQNINNIIEQKICVKIKDIHSDNLIESNDILEEIYNTLTIFMAI